MIQFFFQNLFKKEGRSETPVQTPNSFLTLAEDLRQVIHRLFTDVEVKKTLFDMAPYKSPGNDGFHAGFFQKTWAVVGESLCNFVLKFLQTGCLPEDSNDTLLVLVPEVKYPESITQLRPISLCNGAVRSLPRL